MGCGSINILQLDDYSEYGMAKDELERQKLENVDGPYGLKRYIPQDAGGIKGR